MDMDNLDIGGEFSHCSQPETPMVYLLLMTDDCTWEKSTVVAAYTDKEHAESDSQKRQWADFEKHGGFHFYFYMVKEVPLL
jgi:hypothetical protein